MRKKNQKPSIHSILFSACCFDKSLALFGIIFSYDALKVLFPCLKLKVLSLLYYNANFLIAYLNCKAIFHGSKFVLRKGEKCHVKFNIVIDID